MIAFLQSLLPEALVAGAVLYCYFRKERPPAAGAHSQTNAVNQQGSNNRSIKKKKVKKVSSEAMIWMQCKDLQRTVDMQQTSIQNMEAQLVDKTLINQELVAIIKDKTEQVSSAQRTNMALQRTIERYDREFVRMSKKIEQLEGIPLYDMKLVN